MLAAIHGTAMFLLLIVAIVLGGWILQTIDLGLRRKRKRRRGDLDARRPRR